MGPHDTLVVAGRIGSGKTSLLYSIMNETEKMGGTHDVKGTIAYVEQEPFIFSGTVQENITFGLNFDQERFDSSVNAAQLRPDMKKFSHGAATIVGDRGINISGGQKARIALARAVYSDADIILLDDPLSAVDTHVAKGIFNDCVLGALKNKCVVLVTH